LILAGLSVIVNLARQTGPNVAKKRKTRQEKIILQLKRELARQKAKPVSPSMKIKARQEAISIEPKIKLQKQSKEKKSDISVLSYDPKLIRKDLVKTLILTAIAISLELMLYLNLR